jgi:hypothetical protein
MSRLKHFLDNHVVDGGELFTVTRQTPFTPQLLIYKTINIPIWTYGMELWDCASKSNISIIQITQSKILRMIVDAPWYVSNATI